ncbi:hypothetical protein Py17XNL_001002433 [Plasmodium yoelii yoelii]|uniref:Uncharacterized protein n=1 Tax=Plasmodium yoelii yoelii TaxID=73239 RepID=A0AAE9WQQ7_PLAYO|nr:hypothetical protein Py17XNL_001002433 [Plasmodium yoelii yoelii]
MSTYKLWVIISCLSIEIYNKYKHRTILKTKVIYSIFRHFQYFSTFSIFFNIFNIFQHFQYFSVFPGGFPKK